VCVCVCVYLCMYVTHKHFLYSLLPVTKLLLPVPLLKASKIKTYHISPNVKWALFTVFTFQESTYTDHPSICRHQGNTQFSRCWITRKMFLYHLYELPQLTKYRFGTTTVCAQVTLHSCQEEKDTVPLGTHITEEIIISSIHMVFAADTCATYLSTTWPAELDRINTVTFVTPAT